MSNTINMYRKEELFKAFDKAMTNVIEAFYDAEGAIYGKSTK